MGRPGKPTGRVAAKIAARRGQKMMILLASGMDQSTIARKLNISRQAVHQFVKKQERAYRDRQMIGRLRGDVA